MGRPRNPEVSIQNSLFPLSALGTCLPQSPTPSLFRRDGEHWLLAFAGVTCRLDDTRSLQYLARLLRQPGQEVQVLALVTDAADSIASESAPLNASDRMENRLDARTRAAYQQRLGELRDELEEAHAFNDVGRAERLRTELEALTQELAEAVGVGGHSHRAASMAQRARVNVTRTIKAAIRKITEHHPALGQHLTATIKTGAYCSYTPDPRLPIAWQS